MNWYGSGFIPQIIYAIYGIATVVPSGGINLLAEDGTALLTESGLNILIDD